MGRGISSVVKGFDNRLHNKNLKKCLYLPHNQAVFIRVNYHTSDIVSFVYTDFSLKIKPSCTLWFLCGKLSSTSDL